MFSNSAPSGNIDELIVIFHVLKEQNRDNNTNQKNI